MADRNGVRRALRCAFRLQARPVSALRRSPLKALHSSRAVAARPSGRCDVMDEDRRGRGDCRSLSLTARFSRAPARLAALALLAAALFVAPALPGGTGAAQAQTPTTLVSNTGQATDGNSTTSIQAQSFTTGDNADGYTLSAVKVKLQQTQRPAGGDVVKIFSNSSGAPGSEVATLVTPAGLAGSGSVSGTYTFAAPANTTLTANTIYWLVINEGRSIAASGKLRVRRTASAGETSAASGWSIGNSRQWKNDPTDGWSPSSSLLQFAVNGAAKTPSITSITSDLADETYSPFCIGQCTVSPDQDPQPATWDGVIKIKVVFDAAVTVTGTPTLSLANTGNASDVAAYASGSGGTELVFNWEIPNGRAGSDISVSAVNLAGGTIAGSSGNAVLTLPAGSNLADNKTINIDSKPPPEFFGRITAAGLSSATGNGIGENTDGTGNTVWRGNKGYWWTTNIGGQHRHGTWVAHLIDDENVTACDASVLGSASNSRGGRGNQDINLRAVDLYTTAHNGKKYCGSVADDYGNRAFRMIHIRGIDRDNPEITVSALGVGNKVSATAEDGACGPRTDGHFSRCSGIDEDKFYALPIDGTATCNAAAYTAAGGTLADHAYTGGDTLTVGAGKKMCFRVHDRVVDIEGGRSAYAASAEGGVVLSSMAVTSDPGRDGTYSIGDAVAVTVTFTGAVKVTVIQNFEPRVKINVGGKPKTLSYSSGSGSAELVFTGYTVAEGDGDADGIAIAEFEPRNSFYTLPDGTLLQAGWFAHDAVADDSGHKVDGVRPKLDTSTPPATSADGATITLTFDEDLDAAAGRTPPNSRFSVTVDGAAAALGTAAPAVSGRTVTLTLAAAVTAGQAVVVVYTDETAGDDTAVVQDAAGNDAAGFTTGQGGAPAVVNAVPAASLPSITSITSDLADETYSPFCIGACTVSPDQDPQPPEWDGVIKIKVVFDAEVTVTGTPTLSLANTGNASDVAAYASGSGGTELVFNWEIPNGRAGSDIGVSAVNLAGGTIAGSSGDAVLTLPSGLNLADNKTINIDSRPPADFRATITRGDSNNAFTNTIGENADGTGNTVWRGNKGYWWIENGNDYRNGTWVAYRIDDENVTTCDASVLGSASNSKGGQGGQDNVNQRFIKLYTTEHNGSKFCGSVADAYGNRTFRMIHIRGIDRDAPEITVSALGGGSTVSATAEDTACGPRTDGFFSRCSGIDEDKFYALPIDGTATCEKAAYDNAPGALADYAYTGGDTLTVGAGKKMCFRVHDRVFDEPNITDGRPAYAASTVGVAVISSIAITSDPGSDDIYRIGDAVEATVTFTGDVDVTGTPELEIDVGGNPKTLSYSSGSGSAELVFTGYTVAEGDGDIDGISIDANSLDAVISTGILTKGTSLPAQILHDAVAADSGHKVDGVRPKLDTDAPPATSADGATITLTFDEDLDAAAGRTPPNARFSVTVDGTAAQLGTAAPAVSGRTVTLTLAAAVTAGQPVTVAYTDETTNDDAAVVQDAAGNDAAGFTTGQGGAPSVVNASTDAPAVSSVAISSTPAEGQNNRYKIGDAVEATVTFTGAVDVTGTPQFTINVGGKPKTLSYSSGSSSAALVFTGYTVAEGDEDTDGIAIDADSVALNSGTITQMGDNTVNAVLTHSAVAAAAGQMVDGVRPRFVAANMAFQWLVTYWSEDLDPVSVPPASAFSVTVSSGATPSPTEVAIFSTDNSVVVTHDSPPAATAHIRLDYSPPTDMDATPIKDLAGNTAAGFTGQFIGNHFLRPDNLTIATVAPGPGTLSVSWNAVSRADGYRVQWKTGSEAYEYGGDRYAFVPGGNTTSYTISSLVPGTAYSVQVTPFRTFGADGAPDEVSGTPLDAAVSSVALTSDPGADGFYVAGDVIKATVTFNGPVDLAGGNPELELQVGASPKAAECGAGTAVTKIVCSYTVAAGDDASFFDGVAIGANKLAPNGATVKLAGTEYDAVLTHAAVAADSGHKVDTTPPVFLNPTSQVSRDGKLLNLAFFEQQSHELSERMAPPGAFTVTVAGENRSVESVAVNSLFVDLTLASPVAHGETVTLEYTDPSADDDERALQDVAGNDVASFGPVTLLNNAVSGSLPAPAAPAAPVLTVAGPRTIEVDWDAPADSDYPISGYRIEISPDGVTWTNLVSNTLTTATVYHDGTVAPGSTRYYRISAYSAGGVSPASPAASAQTPGGHWIAAAPASVAEGEKIEFTLERARASSLAFVDVRSSGGVVERIPLRSASINGACLSYDEYPEFRFKFPHKPFPSTDGRNGSSQGKIHVQTRANGRFGEGGTVRLTIRSLGWRRRRPGATWCGSAPARRRAARERAPRRCWRWTWTRRATRRRCRVRR